MGNWSDCYRFQTFFILCHPNESDMNRVRQKAQLQLFVFNLNLNYAPAVNIEGLFCNISSVRGIIASKKDKDCQSYFLHR